MATRQVILLQGDAIEQSGVASGTLTPGALVAPTGAGEQYAVHIEAGGPAAPVFVRAAHEHNGRGIDDTIASGNDVTTIRPGLGAKINAITEETIARGEWVESAGDGTVRPHGSGYRIGYADAASDLSGSVGRVLIVIAPIGV